MVSHLQTIAQRETSDWGPFDGNASPVSPVKPVNPVSPVNPVAPVKPVLPVNPVKPVSPVKPANQRAHCNIGIMSGYLFL